MKNNKKGFALVELLLVNTVVGIMSVAFLAPAYYHNRIEREHYMNGDYRDTDVRRVEDIKHIQTALELYFNDVGSYPAGTNVILGNADCKELGATSGWSASGTGTIYMRNIPSNPSLDDLKAVGCNGSDYVYTRTEHGASYVLTYCLDKDVYMIKAGLNRATPNGLSS